MIKTILGILKAVLDYIITWIKKLLGKVETPPDPVEPERGTYYWIIEKYGDTVPAYYPDDRFDNAKALWSIKEDFEYLHMYLPGVDGSGEYKRNPKGGIIFEKRIKEPVLEEDKSYIGFRKKLAAGTQADGGVYVEFLEPTGAVVLASKLDLLGVISEDGFLEE